MSQTNDPPGWFEWDDTATEWQASFLTAMRRNARHWGQLGIDMEDTMVFQISETLILGVDVVDRRSPKPIGLRTYRVDLHEGRVLVGKDPTCQFVDLLRATDPDVTSHDADSSTALAAWTSAWFERHFRRRIELHEWDVEGGCHCKWKHTGEEGYFMWSDPKNIKRSGLGPPDRKTVIRDFSNAQT